MIMSNPSRANLRWLQAFVLAGALVVIPMGLTFSQNRTQDRDAVIASSRAAVAAGVGVTAGVGDALGVGDGAGAGGQHDRDRSQLGDRQSAGLSGLRRSALGRQFSRRTDGLRDALAS